MGDLYPGGETEIRPLCTACLIGRIEASYDRKEQQLNVKNIWYEPGVRRTEGMQQALSAAVNRLAEFNRGAEAEL